MLGQAFVISKDFGARVAYLFALIHPDRVCGVITMGIPYLPITPISFTEHLPEGFYIARWQVCIYLHSLVAQYYMIWLELSLICPSQKPGRAEADFGRFDNKTVVRNVYILFSRSEIPIARENQEIMDLVDSSTPLPPWFSEEDLANYGSLYQNSGFQTALKVPYRYGTPYLFLYIRIYEWVVDTIKLSKIITLVWIFAFLPLANLDENI